MDRQTLIAFHDELEKIAAYDPELLELLKEADALSALKHSGAARFLRRAARGFPKPGKLTPRGKAKMREMTEFAKAPERTGFAPVQEAWKKELGGHGLHTELTGATGTAAEEAAKKLSRKQFEGSLKQMGAVYPAKGGQKALEKRIANIPGHPREITRTPARVLKQDKVSRAPKTEVPGRIQSTAQTNVARPRAVQPIGTAQTVVDPRRSSIGFDPTVVSRVAS
jgi:hypothetical protein